MSMSELDLTVKELRNAAQSLIAVADSLADLFSGNGNTKVNLQALPAESTAHPSKPISLETVRAVLAEKSRAGHTADVRALLEKHSATKLSEIDPAEYPALLKEAEEIENG